MSKSPVTYREEYREQFISPKYKGWLHFGFTMTMSLAVIIFCIFQMDNVSGWEWITIPLTFLYANFAEYFGHRGPMHHLKPKLKMVFERHTRQHHRFFTETDMEFESSRDFKAVLFPPVLVTFFLFGFGMPVALLLAWIFNANVAYLFALTGAGYFLNYELLHFAHHLPRDHWIAKLPFMKKIRHHHTVHHDQSLMSNYNFNISYPVADWVFGTIYKEEKKEK